jgi:hypothetical protein
MNEATTIQHSVIVSFRLSDEDLRPLYALEQSLATALADAGVGDYDGHEMALIDRDDAYLFLVGPDADRLYEAAMPVLASAALLRGAQITLRYGAADDETVPSKIVPLQS